METPTVACRAVGERFRIFRSRSDMIFGVACLIAILSEVMALEPGDVCEVEIEGVGLLRNSVAYA